jgi:hypothetical protein
MGAASRCWTGWHGAPFEPATGRLSEQTIVCTFSYFSFRSNVARSRGENSCAMEQIWSRTSTSCTKFGKTCTSCDGQVWYRFWRRRRAVISLRVIQKLVRRADGAGADRARWGGRNSKTRGKCAAKGMPLRGVNFMSELTLRPTNNQAGEVGFTVVSVAASFSWAPLTWLLLS